MRIESSDSEREDEVEYNVPRMDVDDADEEDAAIEQVRYHVSTSSVPHMRMAQPPLTSAQRKTVKRTATRGDIDRHRIQQPPVSTPLARSRAAV